MTRKHCCDRYFYNNFWNISSVCFEKYFLTVGAFSVPLSLGSRIHQNFRDSSRLRGELSPENEPNSSSDHGHQSPWRAESMWMCRQVGGCAWALQLLGLPSCLCQFTFISILLDFHFLYVICVFPVPSDPFPIIWWEVPSLNKQIEHILLLLLYWIWLEVWAEAYKKTFMTKLILSQPFHIVYFKLGLFLIAQHESLFFSSGLISEETNCRSVWTFCLSFGRSEHTDI